MNYEEIKDALNESIKGPDAKCLQNSILELLSTQPDSYQYERSSSSAKHVKAIALWKQGRWSIKSLIARFDINELEIRILANYHMVLKSINRERRSSPSS